MRYFTGLHVPDAFIAMKVRGRSIGVFNALEFGRALKESSLDDVRALEPLREKAARQFPGKAPGAAEIIAVLARELKTPAFTVSPDFPAGVYARLTALGVKLDFAETGLFPEREIKSPREARAIREGNAVAEAGFAAAEKVLRQSKVRGRALLLDGAPLTSERLKFAIESACLAAGGVSIDTIAAGGNQACDPHHRGTGPLRANELIIVDIFPRHTRTGYYGDMTRTFLRGKASDAQRKLVAAVRDAQLLALKKIKAGIDGREVHGACVELFQARGFETKRTAKGAIGFFHGTGHGLGLAVHELPRLSPSVESRLPAGAVVTVEPGLYYPGLGGCRIEDVVQVTARAPRMLSDYSYEWEIR